MRTVLLEKQVGGWVVTFERRTCWSASLDFAAYRALTLASNVHGAIVLGEAVPENALELALELGETLAADAPRLVC